MFGMGKLKSRFQGSVAKLSGRKDYLEAVCAGAALIAIADGELEDSEVAATITVILANPTLSGAFSSQEIETTADTMFKRAKSGVSGRMGLYKEVDDIAAEPEMAEAVYATALDIANADGEVEPAEKVVLDKLAKRLKIDPSKFDV